MACMPFLPLFHLHSTKPMSAARLPNAPPSRRHALQSNPGKFAWVDSHTKESACSTFSLLTSTPQQLGTKSWNPPHLTSPNMFSTHSETLIALSDLHCHVLQTNPSKLTSLPRLILIPTLLLAPSLQFLTKLCTKPCSWKYCITPKQIPHRAWIGSTAPSTTPSRPNRTKLPATNRAARLLPPPPAPIQPRQIDRLAWVDSDPKTVWLH